MGHGSLLTLVTLASPHSLRESATERQLYTLLLMCVVVTPNLLVFLKCMWKCAFKSYATPDMKTMGIMAAIEVLVGVGTAVLVLIVMPQFDVLTNLFISGGVCILTAILQIVFRLPQDRWMILFPVCSLILVLFGYTLLAIDYYVRITTFVRDQDSSCYIYVGIAIFACLLVSLNWWENCLQASSNLQEMLSELDGSRDFVFMITSLLRIVITVGTFFLYYGLIAEPRIDFSLYSKIPDDVLQIGLGVFFLQAFCSAACHWFGVVACKIHAVRMSFAFPVSLTGPATLIVGLVLFLTQAGTLDVGPPILYLNYTPINNPFLDFCQGLANLKDRQHHVRGPSWRSPTASAGRPSTATTPCGLSPCSPRGTLCMWLGLITCTYYVWHMKVPRIERTSQLIRATPPVRVGLHRPVSAAEHQDESEEPRKTGQHDKEGKKSVNTYVNDLITVVMEVYRVFTNKEPDEVSIIETPYGGRLVFVLPEGNMFRQNNPCRASLVFPGTDRPFLLPNYDNDSKRKYISDDNTPTSWLWMEGGHRPFHPSAVILLVDRLRMYANVGAACGRISPHWNRDRWFGYQKFEYAVGHWLQKTAGRARVWLCAFAAPGCFSLFRGSALMDDNILKRYTTKASRASEYVQYDQRGRTVGFVHAAVCSRGWRVEYNAASDAYTNAPPGVLRSSTTKDVAGVPPHLANTLDSSTQWGRRRRRGTASHISCCNIFYQIFTVGFLYSRTSASVHPDGRQGQCKPRSTHNHQGSGAVVTVFLSRW
ncbi:hypothetical protein NFI96_010044 [Prochilodus magdalenae]|nr:hypothetical protein NFI96_010044 [Prochilodus magdalenae]